MRFPSILEICTRDVVAISEQASLKEAIEKMIQSQHRNIVVDGGHYFHLLQVEDVIRFNLNQHLDTSTPLDQLVLTRLPMVKAKDNILESIHLLKDAHEYFGVEDEQGEFCGLLTHTDLINSIDPEILMDNYAIGDVLQKNRRDLWEQDTQPTRSVIHKMGTHNADCVLALNPQGGLSGIFTTKDVLRLFEEQSDLDQPLSTYMTQPVETIHKNTTVKDAIVFIKSKPFKRVIVVDDDGKLEGMILQRDLIAMTYNKWAMLMRQFQEELQQLNELLENKNKRYQALAATDPLTGLYNRHKFTEVFATEFLTMKSRNNAMSLVMIDIDHFKHINDTYGHNQGDRVLVEVARLIKLQQRQVDVICRWGGEEFLILLPSANIEQAAQISETLRNKIKTLSLLPNQTITASFGVTQVNNEDTLEELVGRADMALYEAKRSGRDKVVSKHYGDPYLEH